MLERLCGQASVFSDGTGLNGSGNFGETEQNETELSEIEMKARFLRVPVLLFFCWIAAACNGTTTASAIVPVVSDTAEAPTPASNGAANTREPPAAILPTPQVQPAPEGYYQDDNGLRLAIAQVQQQTIPNAAEADRTREYIVLTLALTNFSGPPKDVTGFPFTVWLVEPAAGEEYAPEIYAPYTNALWDAIEKLDKGNVKKLPENQTIRGELFFKTPLGADRFNLVWQPDARREWLLSMPAAR